jgi:hypothetical protein
MFDDSIVSSANPPERNQAGRCYLFCAGFIPARLVRVETGAGVPVSGIFGNIGKGRRKSRFPPG